MSDLSGDQRGEQHQPGAAEEIQAGDEPEEEVPQRAGPTQRLDLSFTFQSSFFLLQQAQPISDDARGHMTAEDSAELSTWLLIRTLSLFILQISFLMFLTSWI